MRRTRIMFEPWQYEELKAVAEREGRSISSLVRGAVTLMLEDSRCETATKLAGIAGLGADDEARGRDHDTQVYGPRRNG